MSNTEEHLLNLLKIAWQNEWRLKSQLAEREDELANQQRIMQLEIDMYKDLAEMYKRMFQISNGECVVDEKDSNLSH